jgi:hypothetical protein
MATIGILDERRFAQAGFTLEKELMNLPRTVYEDVGESSEIESDNVSILLGERSQEPEYIGLTVLVIQSAQPFALGSRWWCPHQWRTLGNMAVPS